MKIKKQHRKKKYLHKLNRKRLHKKQSGTGKVECVKTRPSHLRSLKNIKKYNLPKTINIHGARKTDYLIPQYLNELPAELVHLKVIKEAWDHKKSSYRNLRDMGLATDSNKTIKIPNFKKQQVKRAKQMVNDNESDLEEEAVVRVPKKAHVAELLEKESKAPRERKFMLPKGQVEFITYLLDKYGHDYKAMERDKKNYYQETWKQLRAKVKTFMGIPKQYGEYLDARGLLDKEIDEEELKKQAKLLTMDD